MITLIKNAIDEYKRLTVGMTLKEKIKDYFWEYYKAHIVVGIFAISIIGSMIHSSITHRDNFVAIAFLENSVHYLTLDHIERAITDVLISDSNREIARAMIFPLDSVDPSIRRMQMQRFSTLFTVGELDILITNSSDFNDLITQNAFLRLDEILSQDELDMLSDYIFYSYYGEPFGVNLENMSSTVFTDANYPSEDRVLGITANSTRLENTLNTFRFLLL